MFYSSPPVLVAWGLAGKVSRGCWDFRSDSAECQGFAWKLPHACCIHQCQPHFGLQEALLVEWTKPSPVLNHIWNILGPMERNTHPKSPRLPGMLHQGIMNPTYSPKIQFDCHHEFNKWIQTLTLQGLYPNPHVPASHRTCPGRGDRRKSSREAPGMAHRRVNGSLECSPARQEQEDNLDFFSAYPGTEERGLCSDPLF